MDIPRFQYVTEQEVVDLHDHALREYGGCPGIRDPAALQSCVAQPQMAVSGQERFSTFKAKAAAYCFFIIKNHPFADGNKRTGFLTALHFLLKNNVAPSFDQQEAYTVLLRVAEGNAGLEEPETLIEKATTGGGAA